MQVKLSKAKLMHKRNAAYATSATDVFQRASAEERMRILKSREKHFKSLEVFPLFKKILSKKIPIKIYTPYGKKEYTLLGIGLKGQTNFRRTALVIDEKGKIVFLGEKGFGQNTEWYPYRILQKVKAGRKTFMYEYNEAEQRADLKLWIDNPISDEVKKHLNGIEFINADALEVKRIKKYM